MKNILKILLMFMLIFIGNSCMYFGVKLALDPFFEVLLLIGSLLTGVPAAIWWINFFDIKL